MNELHEYNQKLVENREDNSERLLKYLQHERLYKMMKDNKISRDRSLWKYLEHYAEDRSNEIQRLKPLVEDRDLGAGVSDRNYSENFLNNYFDDN